MSELGVIDKKIKIQGNGIRISPQLKSQLRNEGYYPIALTWLGDDVTGPFSFIGFGEDSPFELRKDNGAYQVFENGKHFIDVTFYKQPKFWDHQWTFSQDPNARGTVFIDEGISGVIPACNEDDFEGNEVLQLTGGKFPYITLACYNGLVIWPSWGCVYNRQKRPCQFCCIPGDFEDEKNLWAHDGWFAGLGRAVEATFGEIGSEISKCSLTVDSGTIPGRDKGAGVYIRILETIRKKLGTLPEMYYIRTVIEPPLDEKWLYALRDAGYTSIQMDVDVYDEAERRKIMPNAKGRRPIADYVKAFKKAKEIFPGEVATQLIAGIQDDSSLLRGVEYFASFGVPTLLTPFMPFGRGLQLMRQGRASVPSADHMKRLYAKAAEILIKHDVPPPQFRGGVSSLSETMGKRHKRAAVFTHDNDRTA